MSDDKYLMQAVIDELNWEPSINSANIGVTAKDGVVTLMGHVEGYSEKCAAEKAVQAEWVPSRGTGCRDPGRRAGGPKLGGRHSEAR